MRVVYKESIQQPPHSCDSELIQLLWVERLTFPVNLSQMLAELYKSEVNTSELIQLFWVEKLTFPVNLSQMLCRTLQIRG